MNKPTQREREMKKSNRKCMRRHWLRHHANIDSTTERNKWNVSVFTAIDSSMLWNNCVKHDASRCSFNILKNLRWEKGTLFSKWAQSTHTERDAYIQKNVGLVNIEKRQTNKQYVATLWHRVALSKSLFIDSIFCCGSFFSELCLITLCVFFRQRHSEFGTLSMFSAASVIFYTWI